MTSKPDVSVVIPTRNRWRLLSRHGLPSALNQVDVDLEVLVVDDGSDDGTPELVSKLADSRIRVLRNSGAPGVPGARNSGAAAARSDWVAFLDDDDLWAPPKLRSQLDRAGPDDGWVFSATIVVDDGLRPLYVQPLPDPREVASRLRYGNIVPGSLSNVLVRTGLVCELGGFDETLPFAEDWDFLLRLSRLGPPVVCDEVHVAYVEHGRRMSLRGNWGAVRHAERLLAKQGPVTSSQLQPVAEWLALEQYRGGRRRQAAGIFFRAAVAFRSPGNLVAAAGALGGDRGMRVASSLLGGSSHLSYDVVERTGAEAPAWLYRAGTTEITRDRS